MSSPAQLPANSINSASKSIRKLDFTFLPIPKNRRLDPLQQPEEQFAFTWRMNLVFATAATVSIMNLYSIQPMLARISSDLCLGRGRISCPYADTGWVWLRDSFHHPAWGPR